MFVLVQSFNRSSFLYQMARLFALLLVNRSCDYFLIAIWFPDYLINPCDYEIIIVRNSIILDLDIITEDISIKLVSAFFYILCFSVSMVFVINLSIMVIGFDWNRWNK